ncbi:ABC transporter ATP-binding protein [Eisenbergiella sp.]
MNWLRNKWGEMSRDISCHLRALKLLFCYNREWALVGITILMDSLSPFVVIYLSSMLLEALYGKRPVREMLIRAAAGAGTALCINVVRHCAAKHKNVMWWGLQYRMAEPVLMKTMSMDYELTENEEVRAMRSRQEEYRKRNIGAYEIFIRFMQQLLTAFLKLVIAVATILPLFISGAAQKGQETPFVFRMAVLTGMLLFMGFILIQRAVRQKDRKKYAITQTVIEKNRLNEYMMEKVVLSTEAGKDIRIFHQEKLMEEYGDNMTSGWRNAAKQLAGNGAKWDGVQGFLSACIGGMVYLYIGLCAYVGKIAAGSVVRYAGAIQQLIQALTDLMSAWARLHRNRAVMEEYLAYLDLKDVKKKGTIPVEKRRDGKFLIEFRNVSFRYPGTEKYVLKGMNVTLEIGERMALVGPNGSGKTTFIKLLCRLYDPTEGSILLNSVDIRKYDYQEYMRLFSVVFQDFQIFPFALGEYVAGSGQVERERAIDAIRRAGLEELLGKMPEGLNTMLNRDFSDQGVEISGGESQKLAMARAIYKNAPFVILDEPTAALDPIAENEIYTRFHEIIGSKTALFISHRLSACRFSKEILVFENGNIIERGSHEDLSEKPGLYRQMWQAQARYYR